MTERFDNSAERSLLRQQVFALKLANRSYRQIMRELGLSSTSVVSRLLHEAFVEQEYPMMLEIRTAEIAYLDAWHERLEEAAEALRQFWLTEGNENPKPEEMAKLAMAAAKLSNERRKIFAVDLPPTLNVNHSAAPGGSDLNGGPLEPALAGAIEDWKSTHIYRDDLEATGGAGTEGESHATDD